MPFSIPSLPIPVEEFPKEYYTKAKGGRRQYPLWPAGIKKTVSIPVMVVGRLHPEMGEKVIKEGMADFIGMTRRLQADPDLPKELASGRANLYRPVPRPAITVWEPVGAG